MKTFTNFVKEENDFIRDNLHFPSQNSINEYAGVAGAVNPATITAIDPYLKGKKAGFDLGKEEGENEANRNYRGDVKITRDVMKVSSGARPGFMRKSDTSTQPVTSLKSQRSSAPRMSDPASAGKQAVTSQNQTANVLATAIAKKEKNPLSRYFS